MSGKRCAVMLIEDDPGHARLVQRALAGATPAFDVTWAASLAEATAQFDEKLFDALLLDLHLPDGKGISLVSIVRQTWPNIPIVVLTSLAGEEVAYQALELGIQDYLVKDCLAAENLAAQTLPRAIRYAIQRHHSSAEIRRLYQAAQLHRKQLEQKNRRLRKLFAVAQNVVENVSHEFRTPLTVIKEHASLIRDGILGPINSEQSRFLDVVGDRADDLNRMVDDMLDVSKLDAGLITVRRVECQMPELIEHVMPTLVRKAAIKNVTLELNLDDDLRTVYCDADKVGRTIINLMVNAIKFCGDAGQVRLSVYNNPTGADVIVAVNDNGPGIRPADLQRIFARFTQVEVELRDRVRGFGLGLSIAQEMVDLNLGAIDVVSRINGGSCFTFTIPVADPLEVSRRFLERIVRQKSSLPMVSLGIIRTAGMPDAEVGDMEPLLHCVSRPTDLPMRINTHTWIILLAGGEKAFSAFSRRAVQLFNDTNRNRLRSPLAAFVTQFVGNYHAARDQAEVVAAINEIVEQKEAAYA